MSVPFATHDVRLAGAARQAFNQIALDWSLPNSDLPNSEQHALFGRRLRLPFFTPLGDSGQPGMDWRLST